MRHWRAIKFNMTPQESTVQFQSRDLCWSPLRRWLDLLIDFEVGFVPRLQRLTKWLFKHIDFAKIFQNRSEFWKWFRFPQGNAEVKCTIRLPNQNEMPTEDEEEFTNQDRSLWDVKLCTPQNDKTKQNKIIHLSRCILWLHAIPKICNTRMNWWHYTSAMIVSVCNFFLRLFAYFSFIICTSFPIKYSKVK